MFIRKHNEYGLVLSEVQKVQHTLRHNEHNQNKSCSHHQQKTKFNHIINKSKRSVYVAGNTINTQTNSTIWTTNQSNYITNRECNDRLYYLKNNKKSSKASPLTQPQSPTQTSIAVASINDWSFVTSVAAVVATKVKNSWTIQLELSAPIKTTIAASTTGSNFRRHNNRRHRSTNCHQTKTPQHTIVGTIAATNRIQAINELSKTTRLNWTITN